MAGVTPSAKVNRDPVPTGANSAAYARAEDFNPIVDALQGATGGALSPLALTSTSGNNARTLADRADDLTNIKDFLQAGDSAALIAAAAVATANNTTLIINRRMFLNTAVGTVSCPVRFEGNGALDTTGGGTVTLTGPLTAAERQIIYGTGVTFQAKVDAVIPQWWGAVSDGVTDDAPALARAHAAGVAAGVKVKVLTKLHLASSVGTTTGTIEFSPGGSLDLRTGGSVSITGPIRASQQQILFSNGGSLPTFTPPSTDVFYPEWWGAVPDATFNGTAWVGTDSTTPMQNCLDAAKAYGAALRKSMVVALSGRYLVSHLLITGSDGYVEIDGRGGVLQGFSTGTYNAVLEITNGRSVRGYNFSVHGGANANYGAAVWVRSTDGTSGSSFNMFTDVNFLVSYVGFRLGDPARPSEPMVSEITLTACTSVGCLKPLLIEGTQAVLGTEGCIWSANTSNWPAAAIPSPLETHAVVVHGGVAHINGGELLSYNGSCGQLQALTDATYGNQFGQLWVNGALMETGDGASFAGALVDTVNPTAIVPASPTVDTISLIGCDGFNGNAGTTPAITCDSSWIGHVIVKGDRFHSAARGATTTVSLGNAAATMEIDEFSFGRGYPSGITPYTGGSLMWLSAQTQYGTLAAGSGSSDVVVDTRVTRTSGNIWEVKNNGSRRARVDMSGNIVSTGDLYAGDGGSAGTGIVYASLLRPLSAIAVTVRGNVATGAAAVAVSVESLQNLTTAGAKIVKYVNGGVEYGALGKDGDWKTTAATFLDDSGTTGSRTVNLPHGINAFAAGATAVTITNSLVTATSRVFVVLQTNDATALLKNVVPAAGSFVVNLNAAATGTTKFGWMVVN